MCGRQKKLTGLRIIINIADSNPALTLANEIQLVVRRKGVIFSPMKLYLRFMRDEQLQLQRLQQIG